LKIDIALESEWIKGMFVIEEFNLESGKKVSEKCSI